MTYYFLHETLGQPRGKRVPGHHNDLGDWCPRNGERTADGACPVFCAEANRIMGLDAGRDEEDSDA